MLKKPEKYDDVQVNQDYTPIRIGGHKGIIMGVEEYENQENGNISLKVSVDTAKDDDQPNYFAEQYRNDTREPKKWSNSAIKYVSLKDDENCVRMLKAFITAVENSNPNFQYNWNKEVDQLKGKSVGLVFGLEEYKNQQGEVKTIAKMVQFRSIDKVENVLEPKVKLLDGTFVSYDDFIEYQENSSAKPNNSSSNEIEITDDMLPF